MNDTISNKVLWKVSGATVEPTIDLGNIDLENFKFNSEEEIVFEKQDGDKIEFSVIVATDDDKNFGKVRNRSEFLLKSFLALLGLESESSFKVNTERMRMSCIRNPKKDKLPSAAFDTLHVVRRFEDLDFSLLKKVTEFIKKFDMGTRDRIIEALNFLYDAINANTDKHAFLSIYGGLNYLFGHIAHMDSKGKSEAVTVLKFVDKGVLDFKEGMKWMDTINKFHKMHYDVLFGRKEVSKKEVIEIKSFFRVFLDKYIEYQKNYKISIKRRG